MSFATGAQSWTMAAVVASNDRSASGAVAMAEEPPLDDRLQGFQRRVAQGAPGQRFAGRVRREDQTVELADLVAADHHLAGRSDLGRRVFFGVERLQQRGGAPVDEALHQRLVERVRQLVLDFARAAAPCLGKQYVT